MSDISVQDEPDNKAKGAKDLSPKPADVTKPPKAVTNGFAGDCVFNDSITVNAGSPLARYNKGPIKAFSAVGRDKAPAKLFAMICDDSLSPRVNKASNYVAIINPSLPRLVASGVIDWAPAGKEKYCYIYEDILGNPVMADDTKGGMAMKPEYVTSAIIRPLINIFLDLRDRDITHGNIRPSNLFDGGIKNGEKVFLGECLSLPASYNQPALYETIDRGMCHPAGRGKPMMEDDLYSFGVTLAVLLRHIDPLVGLSDEDMIERKMVEGSYMALLGKDRFSGAILELLRGLLHDDEDQRWTLDDVLVWMDGRRLSPKQALRKPNASRALNFNHEKYLRSEFLARDLSKNLGEAKKLIDSGDMEQWLMRSLEDKETTERFQKAVLLSGEGGVGTGYAERLITRCSMALYPQGPIEYKSISVYPDGIGAAFTEAYIQKKDIQTYVDFFNAYFISQWVDVQQRAISDISALISRFDGARAFLRQKAMGAGIEKCLYWLNPEIHCLSEKLQKYHVRSPEDMMEAFEKISKLPNKPAYFFDRHIAAFLSTKDRQNIDPYLHELNDPAPYKRVLAEIKTLATIQKRSRMPLFPGITAWVFENVDPVYERFHDREFRAELKKKADRLKDSGDIGKLVTLFDDQKQYQTDTSNFRKSMRYYYDLEEEKKRLDKEFEDETSIGVSIGGQMATLIASILSGIIIVVTLFMGYNGASLF